LKKSDCFYLIFIPICKSLNKLGNFHKMHFLFNLKKSLIFGCLLAFL
jgi:hypothetical protein